MVMIGAVRGREVSRKDRDNHGNSNSNDEQKMKDGADGEWRSERREESSKEHTSTTTPWRAETKTVAHQQ